MCSCMCDVYFDHVLTQRFLIFHIFIMWCLLCYHGRTCSRVETFCDVQVRDHHNVKRPGNASVDGLDTLNKTFCNSSSEGFTSLKRLTLL